MSPPKAIVSLVFALVASLAAGCHRGTDPWPAGLQKRVLVSFPPLFCFTKNVAGPDAAVLCLLTHSGPHGYDPGAADYMKAYGADLFLANGLGLDDFVLKIAGRSANKKLEIVKLGELLPDNCLIHNDPDHVHVHADGEPCCEGEHDPHVWLGLPQAMLMVQKIGAKLAALDPTHATAYEQRAQVYNKELQQLLDYGKNAFKDKKSRKFIASHNAWRYFADAFGLEMVDCIMPQPGTEGDEVKLGELVRACKEQGIRVITYEPQYARGTAETLKHTLAQKGVEVELVELDPLETAPGNPLPDPAHYVEQMRQNIDNLAKALR